MTIDEAIIVLAHESVGLTLDTYGDKIAAIKLGIEALEQLKSERKQKVGFYRDLLPGETKQ